MRMRHELHRQALTRGRMWYENVLVRHNVASPARNATGVQCGKRTAKAIVSISADPCAVPPVLEAGKMHVDLDSAERLSPSNLVGGGTRRIP